jgi:Ca-activated chloride channel family protein
MTLHQEAPDRGYLSARALRSAWLSSRFALSLFLLLLLPGFSHRMNVCAQNDASSPDDVINVRTDLVTIPAFVLDGHKRRVSNLSAADFALRDDGREVKVEYFAVGTERVALAFALDASGSARDTMTRQREIALALFSRFGHGSRIAVLRFGETAEWIIPFTTNVNEVLPAFGSPAPSSRRTAIFDAAAEAVRAYDTQKSSAAERRIIILISDGLDTASTARAQSVIGEALAHGVSIYVIHLPLFAPRDERLAARPASKGFREMAEQTGGRYFKIGDAKSALDPGSAYDLAPVFRSIEEDLRSQYVIGFYPGEAARDGRFHHVEVVLISSSNRKLRVRSLREGYTLKSSRQ